MELIFFRFTFASSCLWGADDSGASGDKFCQNLGRVRAGVGLLPNPKWWTLSAGIFNRAEMMRQYSMPEMLAAALLAVVPSLVMFALCQKVLFSIKLSGAVKG